VRVSGIVHDPGLAPAWQERAVYAYATAETAQALGEEPALHELRVAFRAAPGTTAEAEELAHALARDLETRGHAVHELRVPPLRQHPHQRQMTTVLVLLSTFAALALVLSAVLVASSLAALLARQVREIGVMKAFGARGTQVAALYALLVGGVGAVATALAVPAGIAGGRAFATAVAKMLNLTLVSEAVPLWVFAVQAGAGLVVPLVAAALPIARAARGTVRAALDDHGVRLGGPGWVQARLPVPARNLLRKPGRLALTLALLATGGALFVTALSVSRAWERNLDKIYEARRYDVEIRFLQPQGADIASRLAAVPGVREVERWGYAPAALSEPGRIDVVRTYPDQGHGSLSVQAPPVDTRLVTLPILAGRWLRADDADAVVLNHMAAAQLRGAQLGRVIELSVDGVGRRRVQLVGIVEEVGSPAVAYVTGVAHRPGEGTRMVRLSTTASSPAERTRILRALEAELEAARVGVEVVMPFSELRTAVGDHVVIFIRALLALAVIFAAVGLLGLATAMGTSVVERTAEIGIMKALGATPVRIRRLLLAEALVTSGASWALAMALSVPVTAAVEAFIGRLGFLAPLPFALSVGGMGSWLLLLAVTTLLAALLPIRRANALSARDAMTSI
jgi:putative ABC transport system permease protein